MKGEMDPYEREVSGKHPGDQRGTEAESLGEKPSKKGKRSRCYKLKQAGPNSRVRGNLEAKGKKTQVIKRGLLDP